MGRLPCVVSKAATLLGVGIFVSDFDIWVCVFWIGCSKTQLFPTILHKCWTLQKDLGTPQILRHSHFSVFVQVPFWKHPWGSNDGSSWAQAAADARAPGKTPVEGCFLVFVASQTFFIIFLPCFWFFVPWKFPRCWVAAYGMMTTALWTLRSRNFCNFEPILSHRLTTEGWPWAIQRIWRVLLGEADTGESRKLKIWGWNALKR